MDLARLSRLPGIFGLEGLAASDLYTSHDVFNTAELPIGTWKQEWCF
jgi:hypothetical protein